MIFNLFSGTMKKARQGYILKWDEDGSQDKISNSALEKEKKEGSFVVIA